MTSHSNRQDSRWIAERLRQNRDALAALRTHVEQCSGNPFSLPPYRLSVGPGLCEVGETVTATFRAETEAPPAGDAWMQHDYLGSKPGARQRLALDWQKADDGWTATVRIEAERPGNGRVVWEVAGERLSRVFGVTGERRMSTRPASWWRPRSP